MTYTIYEHKAHQLEITPQMLRDLLIKFFAKRIYISPYSEEELIQLLLRLKSEKEVKEYLENHNFDEWEIGQIGNIYQLIKLYDQTILLTKVHQ